MKEVGFQKSQRRYIVQKKNGSHGLQCPILHFKFYHIVVGYKNISMKIKLICLIILVVGAYSNISIPPFQLSNSRSTNLCELQFNPSTDGNIAVCRNLFPSSSQVNILKWEGNSYKISQKLESRYLSSLSKDGYAFGTKNNVVNQLKIYIRNVTSGQFINRQNIRLDKYINHLHFSDNHQYLIVASSSGFNQRVDKYPATTFKLNQKNHYEKQGQLPNLQNIWRTFISNDGNTIVVTTHENQLIVCHRASSNDQYTYSKSTRQLSSGSLEVNFYNYPVIHIAGFDSNFFVHIIKFNVQKTNFVYSKPFILYTEFQSPLFPQKIQFSKNAQYISFKGSNYYYALGKIFDDQVTIISNQDHDFKWETVKDVRDISFMHIQDKPYHSIVHRQNKTLTYALTDECGDISGGIQTKNDGTCKCVTNYEWNNNSKKCQVLNCFKEHATGYKDNEGKCICNPGYWWSVRTTRCQKQTILDIQPFKFQTQINQCKYHFSMSEGGQFVLCSDELSIKIFKWDSSQQKYSIFQTIGKNIKMNNYLNYLHFTKDGLMFVLHGLNEDLIYYRKSLSDFFKQVQSYDYSNSLVIGDSYKFMLLLRSSPDQFAFQQIYQLVYCQFNLNSGQFEQKSVLKSNFDGQFQYQSQFSISKDGNTVVLINKQLQVQILLKTVDGFESYDNFKIQTLNRGTNFLAVNYDRYPQLFMAGVNDDDSYFILKYNINSKKKTDIANILLSTQREEKLKTKQIRFSKNAQYITLLSTTNQYALGQIVQDQYRMITDQNKWMQLTDLRDVSFSYNAQQDKHYHSITYRGKTILYNNRIIQCQSMQGAQSTNQDGTCSCTPAYQWSQVTRQCVQLDCIDKEYAQGTKDLSGYCICLEGYIWNPVKRECVFACLPIQRNFCRVDQMVGKEQYTQCIGQNGPNCPTQFQFVQNFPECTRKFQLANNGLTILCAGEPDQDQQYIQFKILKRSSSNEPFTTFQTFSQELVEISGYSQISKDGLIFSIYTFIYIEGFGKRIGTKIYRAKNHASRYSIISSIPYIDKPSHISDNHQYVFINRRSHLVYQVNNQPNKLLLSGQIKQHTEIKQTYARISNDGNSVVIFMDNNIYVYYRQNTAQQFKIFQYKMQESISLKESSLDANFDNIPVIYISGSKLAELFVLKFDTDTQEFTLLRDFQPILCDPSLCLNSGYAQWSSLSRNGRYVSFVDHEFYQLSNIQDDKIKIKVHWQRGNFSQISDLYFSDSLESGYEYQTFRDARIGGFIYKLYTGFALQQKTGNYQNQADFSLQPFEYVQKFPSCINNLQLAENGLRALCTGISSQNTQRAVVWKRQSISDNFAEFQILAPESYSQNFITKDGKMIIVKSDSISSNTASLYVFYTESPSTKYAEIQVFHDQKQKIAISDNHQYLVYTTESSIRILKFNKRKFEQVNLIQDSLQSINCLFVSNNGNTIFIGTQYQAYLYHRTNKYSEYKKSDLKSGFNSCAVNINTFPQILLAGSIQDQSKNQLVIGRIQLQSFIFTQIKRFSPRIYGQQQQGYASVSSISDNGEYVAFLNDQHYLFGRVKDGQFYYLTDQWLSNTYNFKTLHFFEDQKQRQIYLTMGSSSKQIGTYAFKIKSTQPQVSPSAQKCLLDPLWDGKYVGDFSCGCLDGSKWDQVVKRCVELCQNARMQDFYLNSCICENSYSWSTEDRQCIIEGCGKNDDILNLRQSKSNSQCLCSEDARWNQQSLICQLDCSKIDNTIGNNGNLTCNCQQQFEWNKKLLKCEAMLKDVSKGSS